MPIRTPDTPTVPVHGATDVVEADGAETALAEVHRRFGADARILDARRVLRGGIGGFFAREIVQLHVAPGPARRRARLDADLDDVLRRASASSCAAAPPPRANPATSSPRVDTPAAATVTTAAPRTDAARSPVDRLLGDSDDELDFGTLLRMQLSGDARASTDSTRAAAIARLAADSDRPDPANVATPPAAVATSGEAAADAHARAPASSAAVGHTPPAAQDGPGWSITALVRLGLPSTFARSLAVDHPADDLAWTMAVARATAAVPAAAGRPIDPVWAARRPRRFADRPSPRSARARDAS